MKISVTVKPSAREERIEKCEIASALPRNDGECFAVFVKEPAREGRANWAVERVIARYFNIAPSRIRLVSGATSRKKIFEIQ